jgi:hypothetical protein
VAARKGRGCLDSDRFQGGKEAKHLQEPQDHNDQYHGVDDPFDGRLHRDEVPVGPDRRLRNALVACAIGVGGVLFVLVATLALDL